MLLPHLASVVVERTGSGVLVWARAKAENGICPSCGGQSLRTHSRYDRRLADGSVAGQQVGLRLRVRRFFCDNGSCPVGTFVEQVDGLNAKLARRTSLCRTVLEHIGLAAVHGDDHDPRVRIAVVFTPTRCWGRACQPRCGCGTRRAQPP